MSPSPSPWQQGWLTLKTLPRLLGLVWQAAPRWLLLSLAVTTVAALVPVGWLYVNKLIIDALATSLGGAAPPWRYLAGLVGLRLALTLVKSALKEGQPYLGLVVGNRFALYANQRLLAQAVRLDLSAYETDRFPASLSRAQRSGSTYPVRAVQTTTALLGQVLNLAGLVGLLVQFNPLMVGLLLLSSLPPLQVGMAFSKKGFALMYKQTPANRLAGYLQGVLTQKETAKEVRLYHLGPYLLQRWRRLMDTQYRDMQALAGQRARSRFAAGLLPTLGLYGAYGWVLVQTVAGRLSLGDFTLYGGAFAQAQSLLAGLVENLSNTYEANLYVADYLDFLALEPTITSPPQPRPFPVPLTQGIALNRVSFTYPGSARPALTEVSLTLRPGESLALVGPNGTGKTTLVKLISRLYDVSAGAITIDGIPLAAFEVAELRRQVAVMCQDFVRYPLTVAENIGLGDVTAVDDRPRIVQAAQAAGIDEWVRSLPQGYDTPLGNLLPGGRELSGGQWQRLGLARAFMNPAPVLILDEPTAALDPLAEFELFERFRQLTQGRTTVFTSHRFSSVRRADRIAVLEQGQLVELGTHGELMAHEGLYARMFRQQAAGYQL